MKRKKLLSPSKIYTPTLRERYTYILFVEEEKFLISNVKGKLI